MATILKFRPPRRSAGRFLRIKLHPIPLSCKVEPETRERFANLADEQGVSVSTLLRMLVDAYVAGRGISRLSSLPGGEAA